MTRDVIRWEGAWDTGRKEKPVLPADLSISQECPHPLRLRPLLSVSCPARANRALAKGPLFDPRRDTDRDFSSLHLLALSPWPETWPKHPLGLLG